MVDLCGALDEPVIDVDIYVMTDLVLEDLIDQLLIGGSYIFQTERYYFIT